MRFDFGCREILLNTNAGRSYKTPMRPPNPPFPSPSTPQYSALSFSLYIYIYNKRVCATVPFYLHQQSSRYSADILPSPSNDHSRYPFFLSNLYYSRLLLYFSDLLLVLFNSLHYPRNLSSLLLLLAPPPDLPLFHSVFRITLFSFPSHVLPNFSLKIFYRYASILLFKPFTLQSLFPCQISDESLFLTAIYTLC